MVELDGRAAHPDAAAFRDLWRDNAVVVAGETVLRYGWRDVVSRPCAAAAQLAVVLHRNGWPNPPRPRNSACPLSSPADRGR